MPAMFGTPWPHQVRRESKIIPVRTRRVEAPIPTSGWLGCVGWLACGACQPAQVDAPASLVEVDPPRAEAADVVALDGASPHRVAVRAVDVLGVAVPTADPPLLTVNGADITAELGENGVGWLDLGEPGTYLIGGAPPALVAVWGGRWDGPDGPAGAIAPVADAAWSFGEAVLIAVGEDRDWGEVWWVPRTGDPTPLARGPASTGWRGVIPLDLDADPWLDVALWRDDGVTLLRGVEGGPPQWLARLRATLPIRDLAAADVDGDLRDDLVAAFDADGHATVEVIATDGSGRFPLLHRVDLSARPTAIAAGSDARSVPWIDVLDDASTLHHHTLSEGEFVPVGQHEPFGFAAGTRLTAGGDFNGDGAGELFASGPRADGVPRQVAILDLHATPITWIELSPVGAWLHISDADLDGTVDLWSLDGARALRILARSDDNPIEWSVTDLPVAGAIASAGAPGRAADLYVAGPRGGWWPGERPQEGPWDARPAPADALVEGLLDVFGPLPHAGGPGVVRWVGVQERAGILYAKVWERTQGAEAVLEKGRVTFEAAPSDFVEAAWCGDMLWVLTGDGLTAVSLSGAMGVAQQWPEVTGTAIACAGAWSLVLKDGEVVQRAVGQPDPPNTIARGAVDLDAKLDDGVTRPVTCDVAACTVRWWPVGPSGTVVTQTPTETVLEDGRPVGGPGELRLVTLGDASSPDLLLSEPEGRIVVVRATPDGPAGPRAWWLSRPLAGPAFAADAEGDGDAELFVVDTDGRLLLSP